MARGFSPFKRRLARRRERFTSRRGGLVIAGVLALLIGGGFVYWQWQVHEALEASSSTETMGEECADLAEANDGDFSGATGLRPLTLGPPHLSIQILVPGMKLQRRVIQLLVACLFR